MSLCGFFRQCGRRLLRLLRSPDEPAALSDDTLKRCVELVVKFEQGHYEVIHPTLHHYRFTLDDGTVLPRISIVEVLSYQDTLRVQGHYHLVIAQLAQPASPVTIAPMDQIVHLPPSAGVPVQAPLGRNADILPFQRRPPEKDAKSVEHPL